MRALLRSFPLEFFSVVLRGGCPGVNDHAAAASVPGARDLLDLDALTHHLFHTAPPLRVAVGDGIGVVDLHAPRAASGKPGGSQVSLGVPGGAEQRGKTRHQPRGSRAAQPQGDADNGDQHRQGRADDQGHDGQPCPGTPGGIEQHGRGEDHGHTDDPSEGAHRALPQGLLRAARGGRFGGHLSPPPLTPCAKLAPIFASGKAARRRRRSKEYKECQFGPLFPGDSRFRKLSCLHAFSPRSPADVHACRMLAGTGKPLSAWHI